MTNSDLLKLFALANRRSGYDSYADFLDDTSAIYESVEILMEDKNNDSHTSRE